jgi:hypothetical protein
MLGLRAPVAFFAAVPAAFLAGALFAVVALVTGAVDCDEVAERAATVLRLLELLTAAASGPGWSAGTQVPSRTAMRSSRAVWPAGSGPGNPLGRVVSDDRPARCFTVRKAGDDLMSGAARGGAPPL